MAKHDVVFTIPEKPLGKADVEFSIKRDGTAFGRLKVSNGSLVWVPKDCKYGFRIDWKKFDQVLRENGKDEK